MRKRMRRRFRPRPDHLDERCLLSGYSPAQITAAYGLNDISLRTSSGVMITGDGTGQTIALVEVYHDPNIQASLDEFDAVYGLPNISLDVINQAGNLTDQGWAGEESMDVEWAHAIAPGANIVVVEAAPGSNDTQGFNDFVTAVQTASQTKGVTVVSMSLGMDEILGRERERLGVQNRGDHVHRRKWGCGRGPVAGIRARRACSGRDELELERRRGLRG